MDPFKILPEEICDEILCYLKVRDIKKASLVSKQWYEMIGKSKVCMDKVRLQCVDSKKIEFYTSILESSRSYQKLVLKCSSDKVKKNTKYLRVMRDIVIKFAETLVYIKTSHDLKLNVDLPKLKELEYYVPFLCRFDFASNGLVTKAKELEKLTVKCNDMDEISIRYFKDFLMKNVSLKVLSIENSCLIQGLDYENLKFKLEEFHMLSDFPNLMIVQDFFNRISPSLKVVSSIYRKDDVAYFMSNFPKLHTITVEYDDRYKLSEFPYNTSITTLKLRIIYRYGTQITEMVQKMQNLQEIEINYIDSEILHILLNCRSLKRIKYGSCTIPRQDLENMKRLKNIEFVRV